MFHSNQQEAQGATGCGKDKQHYERNSIMATRTSRLSLKKKPKKEKQQLVHRTPGSPLGLFSKYKKVPQSSLKPKKQFGTSLEKERAKEARIEHRTKVSLSKRSEKKDTPKERKRLKKIFGEQFERSYERRGKKGLTYGKKAGGMVKGYSTGGSVSRGQYPAQARKVNFKGVF